MHDNPAWHEWRGKGLGASEIGTLLGLTRWESPWSLWARKVGLTRPTEDSQRLRIGRRMESVLAAEFTDATGLYVVGEQTWVTHPEHPFLRATIDGYATESPDSLPADALGAVEFKTDARHSWPDGIPPAIRAQCIQQMACAQVDHCWIVVMHSGFRVDVHELAWDRDVADDWAFMVEQAAAFWQLVVTGTPPDIDSSDATERALREVYPHGVPGEVVDLDQMADEIARWRELDDQAKAIKAETDLIRNRVRATLGSAEIGRVGGDQIVTLRTTKASTYTVTREETRTLRYSPQGIHKPSKEHAA